MKKIFMSLVFLAVMYGFAFASNFIEGLEDIPVMDGLRQVKSDSVSFGNAESRFVETYLSSNKKTFSDVEKFYMNTLPQLGWTFEGKKQNTLSFYRDKEIIEIVREKAKPLLVRITLKSRN